MGVDEKEGSVRNGYIEEILRWCFITMFRGGWLSWITFGLISMTLLAIFIFSLFVFEKYYDTHYKVVADQATGSQNYQQLTICPDVKPERNVNENCVKKLEYDNFILQQNSSEFTYWTAIVGIYSSFVSVCALVGLFISLQQTRKSIGDNREFGEKQTRAYLSFRKINIETDENTGRRNIVTEIENTGNTPAYDVTISLQCIATEEFRLNVDVLEEQPIPNIGPGQTPHWTNSFEAASWAKFVMDSVQPNIHVFIHGRVKYKDTFGNDCWSTIRRFIPKGMDGRMDSRLGFVFCDQGNESEITYKKK